MFKHFSAGNEEIVSIWMEHDADNPLSVFGDWTVSHVRRWLKFNQLITVEERKEPLEKPDGFRKNRTLRIIRPTKIGFFAYEHGKLIEVDAGRDFRVGIGLSYSYWN